MNKTMIIGNLTADPVLREVRGSDGNLTKVCNFTVAVNMRFGGNESTTYFRVAAWRLLAENCAKYLGKGRKVYVEGLIGSSCWQNQNGTWQSNLELNANSVEFLSSPNAQNEQTAAAPARQAAPAMPAVQPNYGVGLPVDPNNGFQTVETDELPF